MYLSGNFRSENYQVMEVTMETRFEERRGVARTRTAPRAVSVSPAVFVISAIPALVAMFLIPAPAVMPSIAVVFVMGAALAALAAWSFCQEQDSNRLTLWDVAGAFVLIACSAGIFSEPTRLVETLTSTVR